MSRTAPGRTRVRTRRPAAQVGGAMPDTGLSVRSRRPIHRRRSPYPLMTVVVTVVGLAAIGWMLMWDGPATEAETTPSTAAAAASARAEEPQRDPTPVFAQEGGTRVHLVIDPGDLTAVAFHQASGDLAQPMTALVPDADMVLASELHAVPPVDGGDNPNDDVWAGCVLRLWRSNRTGEPDTAADMGADPGTPVWSPVSGTVVNVRPYLLYDTYEDYEIHIRPEGREDVDVVLIHVDGVKVKAGDRVVGGVTQLASVRMMSDKIDIQLAGYTANAGDHVHLQFNRIPAQGELIQPGGS